MYHYALLAVPLYLFSAGPGDISPISNLTPNNQERLYSFLFQSNKIKNRAKISTAAHYETLSDSELQAFKASANNFCKKESVPQLLCIAQHEGPNRKKHLYSKDTSTLLWLCKKAHSLDMPHILSECTKILGTRNDWSQSLLPEKLHQMVLKNFNYSQLIIPMRTMIKPRSISLPAPPKKTCRLDSKQLAICTKKDIFVYNLKRQDLITTGIKLDPNESIVSLRYEDQDTTLVIHTNRVLYLYDTACHVLKDKIDNFDKFKDYKVRYNPTYEHLTLFKKHEKDFIIYDTYGIYKPIEPCASIHHVTNNPKNTHIMIVTHKQIYLYDICAKKYKPIIKELGSNKIVSRAWYANDDQIIITIANGGPEKPNIDYTYDIKNQTLHRLDQAGTLAHTETSVTLCQKIGDTPTTIFASQNERIKSAYFFADRSHVAITCYKNENCVETKTYVYDIEKNNLHELSFDSFEHCSEVGSAQSTGKYIVFQTDNAIFLHDTVSKKTDFIYSEKKDGHVTTIKWFKYNKKNNLILFESKQNLFVYNLATKKLFPIFNQKKPKKIHILTSEDTDILIFSADKKIYTLPVALLSAQPLKALGFDQLKLLTKAVPAWQKREVHPVTKDQINLYKSLSPVIKNNLFDEKIMEATILELLESQNIITSNSCSSQEITYAYNKKYSRICQLLKKKISKKFSCFNSFQDIYSYKDHPVRELSRCLAVVLKPFHQELIEQFIEGIKNNENKENKPLRHQKNHPRSLIKLFNLFKMLEMESAAQRCIHPIVKSIHEYAYLPSMLYKEILQNLDLKLFQKLISHLVRVKNITPKKDTITSVTCDNSSNIYICTDRSIKKYNLAQSTMENIYKTRSGEKIQKIEHIQEQNLLAMEIKKPDSNEKVITVCNLDKKSQHSLPIRNFGQVLSYTRAPNNSLIIHMSKGLLLYDINKEAFYKIDIPLTTHNETIKIADLNRKHNQLVIATFGKMYAFDLNNTHPSLIQSIATNNKKNRSFAHSAYDPHHDEQLLFFDCGIYAYSFKKKNFKSIKNFSPHKKIIKVACADQDPLAVICNATETYLFDKKNRQCIQTKMKFNYKPSYIFEPSRPNCIVIYSLKKVYFCSIRDPKNNDDQYDQISYFPGYEQGFFMTPHEKTYATHSSTPYIPSSGTGSDRKPILQIPRNDHNNEYLDNKIITSAYNSSKKNFLVIATDDEIYSYNYSTASLTKICEIPEHSYEYIKHDKGWEFDNKIIYHIGKTAYVYNLETNAIEKSFDWKGNDICMVIKHPTTNCAFIVSDKEAYLYDCEQRKVLCLLCSLAQNKPQFVTYDLKSDTLSITTKMTMHNYNMQDKRWLSYDLGLQQKQVPVGKRITLVSRTIHQAQTFSEHSPSIAFSERSVAIVPKILSHIALLKKMNLSQLKLLYQARISWENKNKHPLNDNEKKILPDFLDLPELFLHTSSKKKSKKSGANSSTASSSTTPHSKTSCDDGPASSSSHHTLSTLP